MVNWRHLCFCACLLSMSLYVCIAVHLCVDVPLCLCLHKHSGTSLCVYNSGIRWKVTDRVQGYWIVGEYPSQSQTGNGQKNQVQLFSSQTLPHLTKCAFFKAHTYNFRFYKTKTKKEDIAVMYVAIHFHGEKKSDFCCTNKYQYL